MKPLIALIIPYVLFASAIKELRYEYLHMSNAQKQLLKSVRNSSKTLGYTLPAIVWQESNAGKVIVSMNESGSADLGVFQLNSKSFLDRWYEEHPNQKRTRFYDSILLSRITTNHTYATKYAIKELKYWLKVHNNSLYWAIASYNTGWAYDSYSGRNYVQMVNKRIVVLSEFMK